jgi:hypothetical protein
MEDGRLVEVGTPESLGAQTSSRYHNLRESEEAVRAAWTGETWRRLELVDGKLAER